jgi:hypothetical protein
VVWGRGKFETEIAGGNREWLAGGENEEMKTKAKRREEWVSIVKEVEII